ncbi:conserved Plasmodium protein, unknown function [Plasmodium gallinaceum]|uniref:Uncharacterized protein n=1 Tax=Plasmodium gallinaceum TaxID=5849 RepID=A0A1J1GYE7_PLAGA|nr:conserved Plasmodium protein, unknown function [Plasmodium gallinaceum]CRG97580.1 conserved Plasmodium protein, unknown function [Plasmodium gallinaceum]
MDIEKVYDVNFSEENILLRKENAEDKNLQHKKDVKNFCSLSENYNFFKSSNLNDELYHERDKNKNENTNNEIMDIYEGKSENFYYEKSGYSDVEKSDFSFDEKSENNLNERNEYSFTEKSDFSLEELNKKRSVSSYPLYDENILQTNVDLEENIYKAMEINTYNENYVNNYEKSKYVPLNTNKFIQRTKYDEENNMNNKKINGEEKIKYIYKTYTAAPISQTEKTGLWLIDTVNELLDKLCDNKKDYYLNSLDIVQKYPNDDLLYTKLNENIKVKWPDFLKLNNLIYYNHILNIYESMYKKFISDEQTNFVQNKKLMKKTNSIPLPKFPYKNLKDRCISKYYENLPELKVINEESEMSQHNNTKNDAFLNFFFKNFIDQIKNKYNEFCDNVGEKLEKVEKKNYNFKEYCMEVSKIFASNILNVISFSKFPVLLNNILESVHACIKYQNEEEIEDNVLSSSSNIHNNNKMETIYSLPLDSCNTTFNLNTTIQLNNIQNKTTPLNSNYFVCPTKEKRNTLFTSAQKKYNYTSNFNSLPKYTKTYANNRNKLSKCFRTDDILKYREMKHNAYINTSMPLDSKLKYFSSKNKNTNKNIHGNESENEKENNKYSEKDSNISTHVFSGQFKINNANNYYTVNSLPLDDSIKLENSPFNKRSQVESSEFLECKSNCTPNY